jgi:pyruvate kinase
MDASTFQIDSKNPPDPHILLGALQQLRQEIENEGRAQFEEWRPQIRRRAFLASGLNLSMYLALRRRELRPLQVALMSWGLSSLGRCEARVLPNLDAVIATLYPLAPQDGKETPRHPALRTFFRGEQLLTRNAEAIFGPPLLHRRVRIMITLPSKPIHDEALLRKLLKHGTNCVNINCSSGSPTEWEAIINGIRQAEIRTGYPYKVMMELTGPRFRTRKVLLPDPGLLLHTGTPILLTRTPPVPDPNYPVQVQCSLPAVLDKLQVGEQIWLNEGKIGTQVIARLPQGILLCVTQARKAGEHLGPDQELNFPDTNLQLAALTDKDRHDLNFVASYADIIAYPFVHDVDDIKQLQQQLRKHLHEKTPLPAIVLKIDTPEAVINLPELIVQAAGQQPLGIMIDRNKLAIEIGYERMAEIQEEILWICEAAHIPVIWGTNVLESIVSKGEPSHLEMTDAAMSERAECVMLGKGPYQDEALIMLDRLLSRMQNNQLKKTPQLRALKTWQKDKPDLAHWL